MENLNTQMDDQLKNRVAELNRANDENRDGRLDAADLKAQLNRIEAQLELQDQQNRGIIANQRKRMVLSVVLCVIILAALAFFSWRMNEAYVNVMDACNRVNDLADTVQTSLDTLDQAQLDSMMQDLPEITAQLKKVDVDALNKVLTELPALMDTVNSLQTQVQNISNWFSSLGSARLRVAAEGCPSSVRCADSFPRGGSLLGCGLMVIRPPRRAILSVDPPAPHKPALFQRALHVDVIGVGVGTHRQALPQAPVNTELPDAAHLPCRRHPVDRCVGQVFGPGTVLHDAIGRLVAGDQAEHGLYGPFPHHHIADAAGGQYALASPPMLWYTIAAKS